jgi:hypothetical protein
MSESHTGQDGLRASRQVVRRSAQALADAIDRMLWAFQNMPEADALRRHLVACKAELNRALESSGYALEVRDGFSTRVRKRLSLAASVASAAARVASACGERAPTLGAARHAELAAEGGIKTDHVALGAARHAELLAAAEPQLDIRREPTGWMFVDFDNGRILVHPAEPTVVQFKAVDDRSGTDLLRAKAQARAYAIDHPVAGAAAQRRARR